MFETVKHYINRDRSLISDKNALLAELQKIGVMPDDIMRAEHEYMIDVATAVDRCFEPIVNPHALYSDGRIELPGHVSLDERVKKLVQRAIDITDDVWDSYSIARPKTLVEQTTIRIGSAYANSRIASNATELRVTYASHIKTMAVKFYQNISKLYDLSNIASSDGSNNILRLIPADQPVNQETLAKAGQEYLRQLDLI